LEKKLLDHRSAGKVAVETNAWLAAAPERIRSKLIERCSLHHLAPGQALHFAGDNALGMYGIVTGALKGYLSAVDHGPYFAHVLTPGTWGGEGPAIIEGKRPVTLVAASNSDILFLQRSAMIELAGEHPELWQFYSGQLMDHLTVALGAIADLMVRSHKERLIFVLLRLGNCRDENRAWKGPMKAGPITIHVSQDELAAAANVGRTTTSRELLKLKDAGLVEIAYGRIMLLDPAGLRRVMAAKG
jgi:CRP/FNR family cyclic AMP-dependent transcriptional regulator